MYGIGVPELIVILMIVIPFIFWIWAFVDIIKNEFTGNNKIVWLLVIIFVPVLGFILYFLIGREQKIKD